MRAVLDMDTQGPVTLLTGLPRSGTTLVCALLNELPDAVALVEPIEFAADGNHARALEQIDRFATDARTGILKRREITSRHIAGVIPDNLVDPPAPGLRRFHAERGIIPLHRNVKPGFRLFIKHLGEFTAMSGALSRNYPLIAIVRNPLHLLAAWQTVDLPIRSGHLRSAECFCPVLAKRLAGENSSLHRQVMLLRWMLEIYRDFAPASILRYEDLVRQPQQTLSGLGIDGSACHKSPLAYNIRDRYPWDRVTDFARALKSIVPLVSHFYPDFEAQLAPHLSRSWSP